jgi:hypothetical protein
VGKPVFDALVVSFSSVTTLIACFLTGLISLAVVVDVRACSSDERPSTLESTVRCARVD